MFIDPVQREYFTNLTPHFLDLSEQGNKNDFLIVNKLNSEFKDIFFEKVKKIHKQSLLNENKRKEDLEIKRLEDIQRKIEEKKRKETNY